MAVSSEKITLLSDLADSFNASDGAKVDGRCIFVRPRSVASGLAATLIPQGWPNPEVNGEPPVIWSPAASGWAGIVNARAGRELAPAGTPFMLTPLVIAMPKPMAEALGWPNTQIGFADLLPLAKNPEGWASVGHPEWGPFRLGKTNPNFSTSGLNFTIAEYYAAVGKTQGLTMEDLARPAAVEFASQIESSVVHYGDITMTFLNNWFAADARGTALTYASVVAVEEKSVIDYNKGNPDGVLSPGETARVPRDPLVAIYPSEGTLYSDSPFIVLDTEWVDADEKAAAALFEDFVQQPENQRTVLEYGFRPNNPTVPLADPIVAANGVDPAQPTADAGGPVARGADRHPRLVGRAAQGRPRAARARHLGLDGRDRHRRRQDPPRPRPGRPRSAPSTSSRTTDDVGLWVFSTDLGGADPNVRELVPIGQIGEQQDGHRRGRSSRSSRRTARRCTRSPRRRTTTMLDSYDPAKINAIVLLTDGQNDDGDPGDDDQQFEDLIDPLQQGSEGSSSQPVRLFTISYGDDADQLTLRAISQATQAATYNASNPATINQVFTAVISNF